MKHSKIEWTDHTFNPWEGCTKVSEGCRNCYAEARNARFGGGAAPNWGPGAPRRRTSVQNWNQPIKWNDAPMQLDDARGHRPTRVFCASLADWLDNEVPIEWLADLLDLIRRTPNLDWLLLTKRPENWSNRIAAVMQYLDALARSSGAIRHATAQWCGEWLEAQAPGRWHGQIIHSIPANIWIGTTVENQEMADKRIPELLRIPARLRFLSCEPLLGPVDLTQWLHPDGRCEGCGSLIVSHRNSSSCDCCSEGPEPTLDREDLIDWVICGGESGHGARPMHPDWARSLRDQCKAAGVPFLFKQWGEWAPYSHLMKHTENPFSIDECFGVHRCGKTAAGRLLDGVEHNEFPAAQKEGGAS